ncbi:MAG TPA: hypothetical protein VFL76_03485 [Edaphocola sp.]|nr:hypothetical protein [Edaphocola sp.]
MRGSFISLTPRRTGQLRSCGHWIGIKTTSSGGFCQIIPVYQPLYYMGVLLRAGDPDQEVMLILI